MSSASGTMSNAVGSEGNTDVGSAIAINLLIVAILILSMIVIILVADLAVAVFPSLDRSDIFYGYSSSTPKTDTDSPMTPKSHLTEVVVL